jgi:hypothetical protein
LSSKFGDATPISALLPLTGELNHTLCTNVTEEAAPLPLRRVLIIGLLVLASLIIVHRSLLFVLPWHEHSDYAVDAIHIEQARHFKEIHGNFSRFGFNHPGPAFYYVYAAGEEIFYRGLHIVPSPYNAHVLSCLILQVFFFWAAVVVSASWVRRPLFVPLTLLAFAIHLHFADNAFISTWPPRVLLMPFLCFVVGAASIAVGNLRHLPITALAGCFLVHGHVAQPLYVLPLSALAYVLGWRKQRAGAPKPSSPFRAFRAAHVLAAACIGVFLIPIAIDLSAGAESNLARILEFETSLHGAGKPLWKALTFFVSYFGYVKKQELFLTIFGPERAQAIGEHAVGYFLWGFIILAIFVHVYRVWRAKAAVPQSFFLSLTGFTALAFLLSLYWGKVQIGSMYEYNGYFFYAILGCMLILFCALVATVLSFPGQLLTGAAVTVVAMIVAWQRQYAPLAIDYSTNKLPPVVRQALLADPLPAAPKYLLFNRGDWGEAVSIALALNREGHSFRADPDWGSKFAPDAEFEPTPPAFDLSGLSTWRLARLGPTNVGAPIRDNLRVYFEPLPFEPPATIDCAENGNLELYTLFGFTSPLDSSTWTIRPYAGLVFDSPPVADDLLITFIAEPFAMPGSQGDQPMTLSVNGHEVCTETLRAHGRVTARVSKDVWNSSRPVRMVLHFPASVAPPGWVRQSVRGLEGSIDKRMFGWKIERIVFEMVR